MCSHYNSRYYVKTTHIFYKSFFYLPKNAKKTSLKNLDQQKSPPPSQQAREHHHRGEYYTTTTTTTTTMIFATTTRRRRTTTSSRRPRAAAMFLHAFVSCATFIVMAAAAAHAQRHALSSDVDHYSSPSVRLSADTSNAGSNARNVLIENDYEVTYGTYFKIVRMKCGFHHAVNNPSRCTKIT